MYIWARMIVLGDDEEECWLVRFTLTKMLKFCLNYPIGQLSCLLMILCDGQAEAENR